MRMAFILGLRAVMPFGRGTAGLAVHAIVIDRFSQEQGPWDSPRLASSGCVAALVSPQLRGEFKRLGD